MISIRRMDETDIPTVQRLLAQLGYEMSVPEVHRRYEFVARSTDHMLTVGVLAGRVVALCHAFVRPALDKPPEVIVQALVVDESVRGSGAGAAMMAAVETWASDRRFASVALASNVVREDAHAFYRRIGYQRQATSHLFRKVVV